MVGFKVKVNYSKLRVDVDPECLRWTPVSSPSSIYNSPYKREASFISSQSALTSPRKQNDILRQNISHLDDSSLEDLSKNVLKKRSKKKTPTQLSKLTKTESTAENDGKKLKSSLRVFNNFTSTTTDDEKLSSDVPFSNGKKTSSALKKNFKKLANSQIRSGESKGLDGGATLDIVAIKSRLVDSRVSSNSRANLVTHTAKAEVPGILNQAIDLLLVQTDSKYLAFRSKQSEENEDADVEDEVDEKSASNGASKQKKRTPDMSSRYRRVAASKSDMLRRRNQGKSSSNTSSDASPEGSPSRRTHDNSIIHKVVKKDLSPETKGKTVYK